ncbi:MAG: hypothetical protein LBH80_02815 [Prevotellaceae bacterium]|nr:hypothetical protein [Prevotellaceae bacterium]
MKRYGLDTLGMEHAIPVELNGERQYVCFRKDYKDAKFAVLEVRDHRMQEAVESSPLYLKGRMKLLFSDEIASSSVQAPSVPSDPDGQPITEESAGESAGESENELGVSYPEVVSYQQAKELLRKEPYLIAHQQLGTPAKILEKARELGVTFPNLMAGDIM